LATTPAAKSCEFIAVEVTSSAVRDFVASALIGWYKESARSLTGNQPYQIGVHGPTFGKLKLCLIGEEAGLYSASHNLFLH